MMFSTKSLLFLTLSVVSVSGFAPLILINRQQQRLATVSTTFMRQATHINATPDGAVTDENTDATQIYRDADVIFSVIDVDGNEAISKEELTDHLSVSGYTVDVINKIFNKMDTNKDSEISKQEFRQGLELLTALRSAPGLGNYNAEFEKEIYEDADQVFMSLDEDKNGDVDALELKNHLGRSFGKQYSSSAIVNIFTVLDLNSDGKISKEELRDAFVRCAALRQAIGEGPNYK